MRVLMFEVGQAPKVVEAENKLRSLQELVGGHIEVVGLGEDFLLIADEEGGLKNKPVNRVVVINGYITTIQGDFFICKAEGEEFIGLTDQEAIYAATKFVYDPYGN